jgi:hypothetical protein
MHDVRVPQLGRRTRLAQEALDPFRAIEHAGMRHLDGHFPNQPRVIRPVDGGKRPCAQSRPNLEAADLRRQLGGGRLAAGTGRGSLVFRPRPRRTAPFRGGGGFQHEHLAAVGTADPALWSRLGDGDGLAARRIGTVNCQRHTASPRGRKPKPQRPHESGRAAGLSNGGPKYPRPFRQVPLIVHQEPTRHHAKLAKLFEACAP